VKRRFVLNRRSKILHRLPSREQCNVDAVPRPQRRYFGNIKAAADLYDHLCWHCLVHETSRKR